MKIRRARSDSKGTCYQLKLMEWKEEQVCPGAGGEGGTGTAVYEEPQTPTALERERALTRDLTKRYLSLKQ